MATALPTLLIAGFLGTGKTTFLRRLLPELQARQLRPTLLLNDYENAAIDAEALRLLADEVRAVDGGCLCCDSIVELVNQLLAIPPAPGRVVLIEANGTSDPLLLIEHLTAHALLRHRFAPLLQLGVVNLARWQERGEHDELELLQARSASHLLFTREDTTSPERARAVRDALNWLNPRAVETNPSALADELAQLTAAAAPAPARTRGRVVQIAPLPEHASAHRFVSLQLRLPAVVDGMQFRHWLRSLPPSVLRAKGVVELDKFPGISFLFQRTDNPQEEPTLFPFPEPPALGPRVVLIGVRLDEAAIRASATAVLGPLPPG